MVPMVVSPERGRRSQRGLTLIELMVAVAVMAILLALAAPSFSAFMSSNRVRAGAEHLSAGLAEARMQAIRLGARVSLCPSSDGSSCSDGGDWAVGWVIFRDNERETSGDAAVDSGDEILSVQQALGGQLKVVGTTLVSNYVSFGADGRPKRMNGESQPGTLRVCAATDTVDDDHRARDLTLDGTGRVRSARVEAVDAACEAPE